MISEINKGVLVEKITFMYLLLAEVDALQDFEDNLCTGGEINGSCSRLCQYHRKDFNGTIGSAFIWKCTAQGQEFWSNLDDKFYRELIREEEIRYEQLTNAE